MIRQLDQKEIKEDWEKYTKYLIISMTSSDGALIFSDNASEKNIKEIYGKLLNPFNRTTHLWVEGDEEYVVLTHIQRCEFTDRQTLVLFSCTRTKDVDKDTVSQRYFNAYPVIAKFAKENNCEGIICYSDLEYFKELAEEAKKFINVVTRYQFYFPL